jgi:hypothetical protein
MTCYFGKHDRIAVGAVILPKIPKIAFHNTNGHSLGVALTLLTLNLFGALTFKSLTAQKFIRVKFELIVRFFKQR